MHTEWAGSTGWVIGSDGSQLGLVFKPMTCPQCGTVYQHSETHTRTECVLTQILHELRELNGKPRKEVT